MDIKKAMHRPVRLRTVFIRYLSAFCIGTLCWALILFMSFSALIANGLLYPANYAEQLVSESKETIASSETVTPDIIPDLCGYSVYSADGTVLSGNMSGSDAQKAWGLVQSSENGQDFSYYYLKIPRKNQVCIVRYTLKPQYKSPILREYLPNPELSMVLLSLLGFLIGTFVLASSFGRKLSKKMKSLQAATEKIKNQDLEFGTESSGVLEIDDVLDSIEKMKDALKVSLKKQWDLEQTRREQISALAHDIKTPLTVVRGNVDLLEETDQSEEQIEYTSYIEAGVAQMERYAKTLIDIAKAETGYDLCRKPVDSKKFLDEICKQITALSTPKKLTLHFEACGLPEFFDADDTLLQRAIMNIAANAVEYSPINGTIQFNAQVSENHIKFCISDTGKGFSPSDLEHATTQFYMGDKSRSSKSHYGMGLFIANSVAEQHGGTLLIANSKITGGGQVVLKIPIS